VDRCEQQDDLFDVAGAGSFCDVGVLLDVQVGFDLFLLMAPMQACKSSGVKLLVFSQFTAALDVLQNVMQVRHSLLSSVSLPNMLFYLHHLH
jgi:hypothetical protein